MKNKLDILNKVTKAEAPPFLYTRISQHLQTPQPTTASVKFKFAFAAAAVLVLVLNVWVLTKNTTQTAPPATMQMPSYSSTINDIYYE